MTDHTRVFVIDDDGDHRASLCDLVEAGGYAPRGFAGGAEALAALKDLPDLILPDLILTDLRMPGMDGIAFITALRDRDVAVPVVMLTGHGDVALAVQAMRAGAEDFLEKPYDADHLLSVMERALRTARLRGEVTRLQAALASRQGGFIGESRAMAELREALLHLGPLDVDVVLIGETGTGKDLAAMLLHQGGPRRGAPFVTLDCATPLADGFEEDLFGSPQGGPGKLVEARGGTLFLDRIDLLPLALQPRLLRALEHRARAGGAPGGDSPGFRVIASATTDLREMVRTGRFREDLYYRLGGLEQTLPPLRAMPTDIPHLFAHFVAQAAGRHGYPVPEVSFGDRKRLQQHPWPGNTRELKAAAERFVLGLAMSAPLTRGPLTRGPLTQGQLTRAPLNQAIPVETGSLPERVARFEAQEIARALDQHGGSATRAARALGIPKRTLNAKIARSGLRGDPPA